MKKWTSAKDFIADHPAYEEILLALLTEIEALPFTETIKWGIPVFTYRNKNIIALCAFSEYCGLWFYYGSLLKDPAKVLTSAQQGTKHLRHWKFNADAKVDATLLRQYLKEALEKIDLIPKPDRKSKEISIPPELQGFLNHHPTLLKNFQALTPFKQREYCEFIATAKQEKTKLNRLEKIAGILEKGMGLNDRYR